MAEDLPLSVLSIGASRRRFERLCRVNPAARASITLRPIRFSFTRAQSRSPEAMRVADPADDVLAANGAFYAAFNARDMDAMASIWAARAPVACIHPGWNVLIGRDAVLDSWRGILSNPEQPRIVSAGASIQ